MTTIILTKADRALFNRAQKRASAVVKAESGATVRRVAATMILIGVQMLVTEDDADPPEAERRLGEMMADQPKATGQLYRGSQLDPRHTVPTLADAGIDKHLAARARKMAAVPPAQFEAALGTEKRRKG